MHQKLVPDPFSILLNNSNQPLHARNVFKIRYSEKGFLKNLKKVNFFFSNPVSFNGEDYQKQRGSKTSDPSLFRLQSEIRKIPLLVMYYLTKFDDVT